MFLGMQWLHLVHVGGPLGAGWNSALVEGGVGEDVVVEHDEHFLFDELLGLLVVAEGLDHVHRTQDVVVHVTGTRQVALDRLGLVLELLFVCWQKIVENSYIYSEENIVLVWFYSGSLKLNGAFWANCAIFKKKIK